MIYFNMQPKDTVFVQVMDSGFSWGLWVPAIVALVVVIIGSIAQWRVAKRQLNHAYFRERHASIRTLIPRFVSYVNDYHLAKCGDADLAGERMAQHWRETQQIGSEIRLLIENHTIPGRALHVAIAAALQYSESADQLEVESWGSKLSAIEFAARDLLKERAK